jgi:hypothetical protein
MRFSKVAHDFGDDAFEYFAAYTDSQAMLSLMKQKHRSPRRWRVVTCLSKFDIQLLSILLRSRLT